MDRFNTIASLVSTYDVYDIGSDHGILAIMLASDHHVVASDISKSSYEKIKKNVSQSNKDIEVILSDGLKNIETKKNGTIIIAGMGTYTILKILKNDLSKLTDTLIIQTNNNYDILRREVTKLGYYIDIEKTIYINRWYTIIRFRKGHKKYSKIDYLIGPNPIKEYALFNQKLYIEAYNKIPKKYFIKRLKMKYIINKIGKYVN